MNRMILTVGFGFLAAANCLLLIFTTDLRLLVALNLLMVVPVAGLYLFITIKTIGLARELGLTKAQAGRLVRDYFNYYRNVERISIYEYHERVTTSA